MKLESLRFKTTPNRDPLTGLDVYHPQTFQRPDGTFCTVVRRGDGMWVDVQKA